MGSAARVRRHRPGTRRRLARPETASEAGPDPRRGRHHRRADRVLPAEGSRTGADGGLRVPRDVRRRAQPLDGHPGRPRRHRRRLRRRLRVAHLGDARRTHRDLELALGQRSARGRPGRPGTVGARGRRLVRQRARTGHVARRADGAHRPDSRGARRGTRRRRAHRRGWPLRGAGVEGLPYRPSRPWRILDAARYRRDARTHPARRPHRRGPARPGAAHGRRHAIPQLRPIGTDCKLRGRRRAARHRGSRTRARAAIAVRRGDHAPLAGCRGRRGHPARGDGAHADLAGRRSHDGGCAHAAG